MEKSDNGIDEMTKSNECAICSKTDKTTWDTKKHQTKSKGNVSKTVKNNTSENTMMVSLNNK